MILSKTFKEDIERLKKNDPAITILNLCGERIYKDGAASLAAAIQANTYLEWLDLQDSNIGDEGAAILAADVLEQNYSTIKKLNLHGNKIGNNGATALATALKINTSLWELDLCFNFINDEGVSMLAKALTTNTTLRVLRLEGNRIGERGATILFEAVQANLKSSLETIELSGNWVHANSRNDINTLLDTRHASTERVRAMEQRAVPYMMSGGKVFKSRDEIKHHLIDARHTSTERLSTIREVPDSMSDRKVSNSRDEINNQGKNSNAKIGLDPIPENDAFENTQQTSTERVKTTERTVPNTASGTKVHSKKRYSIYLFKFCLCSNFF